jgi:hypothetical protein
MGAPDLTAPHLHVSLADSTPAALPLLALMPVVSPCSVHFQPQWSLPAAGAGVPFVLTLPACWCGINIDD